MLGLRLPKFSPLFGLHHHTELSCFLCSRHLFFYKFAATYSSDLWINSDRILKSPSMPPVLSECSWLFPPLSHSQHSLLSAVLGPASMEPEAEDQCVHLCMLIKISSQILSQVETLVKVLIKLKTLSLFYLCPTCLFIIMMPTYPDPGATIALQPQEPRAD